MIVKLPASKTVEKYHSTHAWVRLRKNKPNSCEWCENSGRLELANVSGDYQRDVNDYIYLCPKCHKKYDGIHERQRAAADERWAKADKCKNGHSLLDNYYSYIMKNGRHYRECKTCNKDRTKERRANHDSQVASRLQ